MQQEEFLIENDILAWVNFQSNCFAFKVETRGFYNARLGTYVKNRSRFVLRGTSDILGSAFNRFLAIEVKSPAGMRKFLSQKGEHERNQKAFLDKVHEVGGIAICVCSVDQVVDHFQKIHRSEIQLNS